MSSFAERNREAVIRQLQGDDRIGGDEVLSVAPVMRVSIMMLVISGILGVMVFQVVLGSGGIQFGLGLAVGYGAYVGYLLATMGHPKLVGAMAVLTNKRVLLLGSKKIGVAGDWEHRDLETIELNRKGNFLVMGRITIVPTDGQRLRFFLSNRRMGMHFMETYGGLRK